MTSPDDDKTEKIRLNHPCLLCHQTIFIGDEGIIEEKPIHYKCYYQEAFAAGQQAEREVPEKFILDACCGGRTFWFNKNHPATLYIDIRKEDAGFLKERPNLEVRPDKVMDFRKMEFKDKTFKLVIFDPPHLKTGKAGTGWMSKKYGTLNPKTWATDLKQGFDECWRVLDNYGALIFKWSSVSISIQEVLRVFGKEPLFGHPTGKNGNTMWVCFMKIPKEIHHSRQEISSTFSSSSVVTPADTHSQGKKGTNQDCSLGSGIDSTLGTSLVNSSNSSDLSLSPDARKGTEQRCTCGHTESYHEDSAYDGEDEYRVLIRCFVQNCSCEKFEPQSSEEKEK